MKDSDIRRYARLMRELGLTGLEIDEAKGTLRLECAQIAPPPAAPALASAPVTPALEAAPAGALTVTSPIVGVFYAAPMENAEPYVKIGDRVKKGDVLCIVEAMKLMNEIVAEADGVITDICVQDGQLVDYGCVLFRMEAQA
ncbi:MAG: acetyl-CoA carboxylase, biotin carboxyl carrier protein [Oscillospiraceae bacterium]|nr:acetyl-CoA carboxylase, biotin carboxyl carrier protein [Oscillospiraceae bacterium]